MTLVEIVATPTFIEVIKRLLDVLPFHRQIALCHDCRAQLLWAASALPWTSQHTLTLAETKCSQRVQFLIHI